MAQITRRKILYSFVLALAPAMLVAGLRLRLSASVLAIIVLSYFLFMILLAMFVTGRRRDAAMTKKLDSHYRQLAAFISLNAVIKPVRALPAMGGSAVCPDLANILVSLILSDKPRTIVEFGSGVSTIISCYCVQKNGVGHIWSLDHEDAYACITRKHLETHGLEQYATVLHAPLREHTIRGQKHLFYDLESIEDIGMVDFLIVDGPPRTIDLSIRYAALPLLAEKLSPNAVVLLDDAARPAEQEIIKLWQEQFPDFRYEWYDTEKGAAIFRRGH